MTHQHKGNENTDKDGDIIVHAGVFRVTRRDRIIQPNEVEQSTIPKGTTNLTLSPIDIKDVTKVAIIPRDVHEHQVVLLLDDPIMRAVPRDVPVTATRGLRQRLMGPGFPGITLFPVGFEGTAAVNTTVAERKSATPMDTHPILVVTYIKVATARAAIVSKHRAATIKEPLHDAIGIMSRFRPVELGKRDLVTISYPVILVLCRGRTIFSNLCAPTGYLLLPRCHSIVSINSLTWIVEGCSHARCNAFEMSLMNNPRLLSINGRFQTVISVATHSPPVTHEVAKAI